MISYSVKKQTKLRTTVDCLEGRMTGNDAIRIFNQQVECVRRRGKIRHDGIPLPRGEGLRLTQLENARHARAAHAVNVSPEVQEQIRKDHVEGKLGLILLRRRYGFSSSVIRRILGER